MKKYKSVICAVAAACLLGLAAFSVYHIYDHYAQLEEQTEAFEEIAETVEQAPDDEPVPEDVPISEGEDVLAKYQELYLQNEDMVGWISIDGTTINYPVMQTKDNPNYYLKRNFEKEYSDLGTPYIQEDCDLLTSDNLIIYGHHISGNRMFGALEDYKSKSFYEEHKTIRFDTLTQQGEEQREMLTELLADENNSLWSQVLYGITSGDGEIVSVALSQVGNVGGQPYWSWYGFGSRVEWCACFVSWCANESGYIDTGVIPKFAGCVLGSQWFMDRGQWQDGSFEPSAGHIIFFDWEGDGVTDHVGIVERVENGTVYTVEGNSGDSVRQNSYPIGSSVIYGYGIPAY